MQIIPCSICVLCACFQIVISILAPFLKGDLLQEISSSSVILLTTLVGSVYRKVAFTKAFTYIKAFAKRLSQRLSHKGFHKGFHIKAFAKAFT